jgi:hypothetical protein
MTGGLVVVDDAGHFGGNMDEQFTAAIDAMADELPPAYRNLSAGYGARRRTCWRGFEHRRTGLHTIRS